MFKFKNLNVQKLKKICTALLLLSIYYESKKEKKKKFIKIYTQ